MHEEKRDVVHVMILHGVPTPPKIASKHSIIKSICNWSLSRYLATHACMGRSIDRSNGWMDGWMDGWIDAGVNSYNMQIPADTSIYNHPKKQTKKCNESNYLTHNPSPQRSRSYGSSKGATIET